MSELDVLQQTERQLDELLDVMRLRLVWSRTMGYDELTDGLLECIVDDLEGYSNKLAERVHDLVNADVEVSS